MARGIDAQSRWSGTTWAERREVLCRAADLMAAERGSTLALMARTAGKTVGEGDPEVSEAIDFARYASHLTRQHEDIARGGDGTPGPTWHPSRIVVVAGPWNFPYAIPASGLVHAIAAGCSVVMKPAPETRAVAAHLVDQLLRAGVPDGVVQLACTPDDEVGRRLVTHPDVDLVMLTGSYDTASMFLDWKPDLHVQAETSGKNALVITAAADLDQAIKDLVRSAFGHSGQKCSAASLAIVEASVYDDPSFHRRLADAVRSLRVGSPLDPATKAGPLIAPPTRQPAAGADVARARRALARRAAPARRRGPGVVARRACRRACRIVVPSHRVLRTRARDHARSRPRRGPRAPERPRVRTDRGLHSLDPREIDHWLARVHVGNAYVNRHITGAIVERQPFGGWKASSVGTGSKPGGPNHLHGYGRWTPVDPDPVRASASFRRAWDEHFGRDNDPAGLACEANVLRYRPLDRVIVLAPADDTDDRALASLAAGVCGVPMTVVESEEQALSLIGDAAGAVGDPDPGTARRVRHPARGRPRARRRRRHEPVRRRRPSRAAALAARAVGVAHHASVRPAAAPISLMRAVGRALERRIGVDEVAEDVIRRDALVQAVGVEGGRSSPASSARQRGR